MASILPRDTKKSRERGYRPSRKATWPNHIRQHAVGSAPAQTHKHSAHRHTGDQNHKKYLKGLLIFFVGIVGLEC